MKTTIETTQDKTQRKKNPPKRKECQSFQAKKLSNILIILSQYTNLILILSYTSKWNSKTGGEKEVGKNYQNYWKCKPKQAKKLNEPQTPRKLHHGTTAQKQMKRSWK